MEQHDARQREERLPVIDLFRLVSILLVMALHVSAIGLGQRIADPFWAQVFFRVTRNGVYGVSLFFVVSGYVITRSIVARHPDLKTLDLRAFYVRRAGRILPPLVLAIVAGVLAVLLSRTPSWFHNPGAPFDVWFVLSLVTFSFNWLRIARRETGGAQFGAHWDILWSLAIEEQFYLLYPLALRGLRKRRTIVLALLLLVLGGAAARFVATEIEPSFIFSFTNSFVCFDFLALGCLVFFALERLEKRKRNPLLENAIGVGALGLLLLTYFGTFLGDPTELAWTPTVIGLTAALTLGVGIRNEWCASRAMRLLTVPGQWSYAAYLFHPLLFLALGAHVRRLPIPLSLVGLSMATFAVSFALHRWFERPVNQAIRNRWLTRE